MNAKEEFLKAINKDTLKCAVIEKGNNYAWLEDDESPQSNAIMLPINYTEEEYNQFLNKLDFDYNSGYGCQELFGTIWNNDGSWLDRGEYDGAEWWKHQTCPEIPINLQYKTKEDYDADHYEPEITYE